MKIFKFILRGSLLVAYIILALLYPKKILKLDFYWYIPIYLYFLYLGLKNFMYFNKDQAHLRYLNKFYKKKSYDSSKINNAEKKTQKGALLIMIIWYLCLFTLGILYFLKIVNEVFIIGLVFLFNFLDLICQYVWCPFKRVILKNNCCMDCRIANWDTFFLFSPLLFIFNFYTTSLFIIGLISLITWELSYKLHRERFYKISNALNSCQNCQNQNCSTHKNENSGKK